MPVEFASFAFIITLAAVINGLGIVRWLTGLSEYLRGGESRIIQHYWVFSLFAGYQFLLHILMWWSLWSVRGVAEINFLMYVYLLVGPVLLFLGTSVLAPNFDSDTLDTRAHYFGVRKTYSSVLALLWLWAMLLGLVLRGALAPTFPIFALFFAAALLQRFVKATRFQGVAALANWTLLLIFVSAYAMQLGGIQG